MENKKRRYFTYKEDRVIINMARAGACNTQIAEVLERSAASVGARRDYLIRNGIDIPRAPKSRRYVEIDGGCQVRIEEFDDDNPVASLLAALEDMRATVLGLAAKLDDVKRKEDLFRQMQGLFGGQS